MFLYLFACIDPGGTVVGNPGSNRDPSAYMARVTVAESDGFTYTQASIAMDRVEYFTADGVMESVDVSKSLDLLSDQNAFDLRAGSYTKVAMYFSETVPFALSYQHAELESGSLAIPLKSIIFQHDNLVIDSDVVLELGSPNWLTLQSFDNIELLGAKISYQSEIYDDENSNGVVEEEEREEPITEPSETNAENYELAGRWRTSAFFYDGSIYEGAVFDFDEDGYLFSSERRTTLDSEEEELRVRSCGMMVDLQHTQSGEFTTKTFQNDDVIHSTRYTFLDQDTLLLFQDSDLDGTIDAENMLTRDTTAGDIQLDFSVPIPMESNTIEHLNFQNVSIGTVQAPVYSTTSENLSIFACEPERFYTEPLATVGIAQGLLLASATEQHEKNVWVHIPVSTVSYIHFDGDLHLRDSHSWNNLWLSNGGNNDASFIGTPNLLHIQTLAGGSVYAAGTANWLDIHINDSAQATSMIYAYDMPAVDITVSMAGEGEAQVQPLQTLEGTLSGSGNLYIANSDQIVNNVTVEGPGEAICVCEEENPPQVCE